MARHAHISRNNKFAISLQHLEKEVNDAVGILHEDKHESLPQIDTMVLMEMVKYSQSSQNSKFPMSLQYLQKELEIRLTFWMHINIKVSYKLFQHFRHQRLLQGDTITIDGYDLAFSKYSE